MKLKQYPKHKESGIQWIGKIPDTWEIYRLKHLVSEFVAGGTPSSDDEKLYTELETGIPWVAISDMTNKDIINHTEKRITLQGLSEKRLKILKKGTLIYSIFASLGKVSTLGIDATTNQAILGLILTQNIDKNYLKYYLKDLEEPVISLSNANTQNNLNTTIVKNINLAIPSDIKTQSYLSYFLDTKSSEIDSILSKDQHLIDLLKEKRIAIINHVVTKGLNSTAKMKDSGIEWIEKIPEGWRLDKLKHVSDIMISNIDKKSEDNEPDVLLCNYIDVYKNDFITSNIEFMKATASIGQILKLTLKKNDVMITKDSEEATDIAVPALVTENLKGIVCGYHLALIRSYSNSLYGPYLFRSFQSKKINDQFYVEASGVTRFGISTYPIANSYLCIPPKSEQIQIAEYLDKETKKIDQTIEKIEKKIELLEEFKKSLIHHVVTGKVDIRGMKA